MEVFQIIGQPGSGKTTLTAEIVNELCQQNLSVGTIKHSAHAHELDKPGKDSFIHRISGACPASMMTRDMAAVYLPRSPEMTPSRLIEQYYAHLDIVLIEGWISGPYNKIEVWRECLNRPFLFPDVTCVKAIVTDDSLVVDKLPNDISYLKRDRITKIIEFIIGQPLQK